jgi:IPT/TIG domain/Fibronectin type III domain
MKRLVAISMLVFCGIGLVVHFSPPSVDAQSSGCTDQALTFAESQIANTLSYIARTSSTPAFPSSTNPANGNQWYLNAPGYWTSGFFPGELWFMYEQTLSGSWLTQAQAQTGYMQAQDVNASDHDIGFKILGSYGNAYRITRDPADMAVIQTAANAMDTNLWRPIAGVYESWPSYDSNITVIIDNMMNLELPLFAAKNGGNPAWRDHGVSHALQTMKNHVRTAGGACAAADGSTFHVVDYSPTDGTVVSQFTVQGASNCSTWSRGQAWAIYGFTMVYRYTKDDPAVAGATSASFLTTAQRLADYFISQLPSDFVPYWDFSQTGIAGAPRDSSAAAIAAAGLLELSTYVDATHSATYRNAALNILSSLSSSTYLGNTTPGLGILLHGSANVPGNSGVDVSLVYGDYYFIQGCNRARSVPTAPTNVTATAALSGQINLAWDAQSGPVRYSVKRSTTSGGPYTTIAPPPILTSNSYTDSGRSQGSTYFYVVSAINASGESPNSAEVSAPVDNPVPAISSLSPLNVPAGTAFVLTVNGSNFLPTSVVNFGGQPQPTTFVSSTQLTGSITASAVASAGTVAVSVANPMPGGGPSAPVSLTLDDFALSVPSGSVTLSSGKSVTISLAVAPSDGNGFPNPILFSVSGLPSGVSGAFNPPSVTPGTKTSSTTLTLSSTSQSQAIGLAPNIPQARRRFLETPWLLHTSFPVWLTSWLLACLTVASFSFMRRRGQQGFGAWRGRLRFAISAALLLGLATFSGCAGGSSSNTTTSPPSPQPAISHLTVTATSGTDTKTTVLTLTVQ